jgi:mono/diheme cytochrome c family protein
VRSPFLSPEIINMRRVSLLTAGAVGSLLLVASAHAAGNQELPDGPNRALVYGQCRTCHDLQYLIESAGIPRDSWNDIIDSMGQYGLRITPEQRAKILDYLATYMGPNPPPASTAPAPAKTAAKADGAAVYGEQCVACHQANGGGAPGTFPPLAKNPDIFLSEDFPVRVVLSGLDGKITAGGRDYDGVMPPLGELLNDEEIAAVVNYVREAWGNNALMPKNIKPVDAATVAALRQKKETSAQVSADRKKLKAAAAK